MSTTHTTPTSALLPAGRRPASASASTTTQARGRSRIDQILALIDEALGDTVPAR